VPRIHNYYAGPAALPQEVLEQACAEMLDFRGSGMSVMETSHRSKEYEAVHNEAIALFKELMGMGEEWKVLFLQGGASLQFAMVPMNFLAEGRSADYILTGSWSKKALKEAKLLGKPRVAATTEENGVFNRIPKQAELKLDPGAVYCHITSNNTIFGTQWHRFPDIGNVPLVADMSSDILSRPMDVKPFGLIYAGAQKNLGPSGVTVVAIHDRLLAQAREGLPTMLSYKTHIADNSLYNTPPSFAIYILNLTLNWLKKKGGTAAMGRENAQKTELIYGAIDGSSGFYRCPVERESRSQMNVVFRLPSEDLEAKFISEGKKAGFVGLKGHRSVGGIRVSIYNANGLDSVKDITTFMKDFAGRNS